MLLIANPIKRGAALDVPAVDVFEMVVPVKALLKAVRLYSGMAADVAAVIVDVHNNGTTLFTDQGDRPRILDGDTEGEVTGLSLPLEPGDLLSIDLDQVDATGIGAPFSVVLELEDRQRTFYMDQAPPELPHIQNDEFNGLALGPLWTLFQPADASVSVQDSCLKLVQGPQGSGAYMLSGVFQPVPSGDWTIIVRTALLTNTPLSSVSDGSMWGSIALLQDAAGNPNTCDLVIFGQRIASTGFFTGGFSWTNHNGGAAPLSGYDAASNTGTATDMKDSLWQWFKIVKTGTNYDMYSMPDRRVPFWQLRYTGTLPFTPAEVGFLIHNTDSTLTAEFYCDCFRVFVTEPIMMGGKV